jgi:hypothetical protein
MPRYVFRRKAGADAPSLPRLAERVKELGGRVIATTDDMVHIEAPEKAVQKLQGEASEFVCAPEATFTIPAPPRVKVRKRAR